MFHFPLGSDAELRLLEVRHAEALFGLVEQNREHLRRWLIWVDATQTAHDIHNFIRAELQRFADQGFSQKVRETHVE